MSLAYDEYLSEHIGAVQKGWNWMIDNLIDRIHPWIREQYPNSEFDPIDILEISEQMQEHDASKIRPEEYYPYDAYFYGGNKSHAVVENFRKAFLLHIHENPHHWQYWVLIHDDPNEPETLIEIPLNYIFEMICDWWSFSWRKGNPMEIFNWWDEHKNYIRMHKKSRKILEYILKEMKNILMEGKAEEDPEEISHSDNHLEHHGIKGQKWGVRRFQNKDGTRTNKGKEREYYRRRVIRELKNIDDVNRIVSTLSDVEQRELGLSSGDDKWIPDEKRIDQASNIAKTFLEYDGDIPISMLEIWDIGDGRADIALATDPKYRGTGATSRNIKNAIKWFNSQENTKFNELQWNNLKENPKSGEIADHYGFSDYIDDDKWEYRRIFKNEGKIAHADISDEEKEDKNKFGLPDLKKYPMPDPDHVKSAIRFFNYVDPKYEKELAEAILERMKEYNMSFEDFGVGDENRFKNYIPKADQKDTEDKKSD